jgi:hypothetical protein
MVGSCVRNPVPVCYELHLWGTFVLALVARALAPILPTMFSTSVCPTVLSVHAAVRRPLLAHHVDVSTTASFSVVVID